MRLRSAKTYQPIVVRQQGMRLRSGRILPGLIGVQEQEDKQENVEAAGHGGGGQGHQENVQVPGNGGGRKGHQEAHQEQEEGHCSDKAKRKRPIENPNEGDGNAADRESKRPNRSGAAEAVPFPEDSEFLSEMAKRLNDDATENPSSKKQEDESHKKKGMIGVQKQLDNLENIEAAGHEERGQGSQRKNDEEAGHEGGGQSHQEFDFKELIKCFKSLKIGEDTEETVQKADLEEDTEETVQKADLEAEQSDEADHEEEQSDDDDDDDSNEDEDKDGEYRLEILNGAQPHLAEQDDDYYAGDEEEDGEDDDDVEVPTRIQILAALVRFKRMYNAFPQTSTMQLFCTDFVHTEAPIHLVEVQIALIQDQYFSRAIVDPLEMLLCQNIWGGHPPSDDEGSSTD